MPKPDPEYNKIAEPYQYDIGFAYFAVKLGWSLSDYEEITPRQRNLIIKEIERQEVAEDIRINSAVINAIQNTMRKKSQRFIPLWKKKKSEEEIREGIEKMKKDIQEIVTYEETNGKAWVNEILKANGINR